jgi:hypothetical protein
MKVKYTGSGYSFGDTTRDELQRAAFLIACNESAEFDVEKWCRIYAAASRYPYKDCIAYLKATLEEMRDLNDTGKKFACRVLNFTEVD